MPADHNPVISKYDEFQSKAVTRIASDFTEQPNGRFLLVIPTGGGKTFTAVKSIARLFKTGTIDITKGDLVLWVAHRTELIGQANDTIAKYFEQAGISEYINNVKVEMLSKLDSCLQEHSNIKLLVIDEAHHSAAPSYSKAFDYKDLGILGLTATPSRHDGESLPFERESFSIGFPDLVKKGIVLRPKEYRIEGGTYNEITDLGEGSGQQLEVLNNDKRNAAIATAIKKNKEDFHKIVIFLGTKKHTQDLADHLIASGLKEYYDSITWITGDGNSLGLSREEFITREKAQERSIIVNVDVLTEGYDDPTIDTVIMARPTSSKLVFMQAMGRCIRHDPNNSQKVAKLVQVHDQLPNIRYLIENRMLYSDVSDTLEPEVKDIEVNSPENFLSRIKFIFEEYKVPKKYFSEIPVFSKDDRYSLLLFKVKTDQYQHYPVWLNRDTRQSVTNSFNLLSARMEGYKKRERPNKGNPILPEKAMRAARVEESFFGSSDAQVSIFEAMKNSYILENSDDFEIKGRPWITYFSIQYHEDLLPAELLEFCKYMVNRDAILELIKENNYVKGDSLFRIPLPLVNEVGIILDSETSKAMHEFAVSLKRIKDEHGDQDHYRYTQEFVEANRFPLPMRHLTGFIQAIRSNSEFSYKL